MNILCVIPARYESTRFPGKPLADIMGRPMLWWVYSRVKDTGIFSEVICAVDDERIKSSCEAHDIPCLMTSSSHPEHISRVHEVSEHIKADYYVCINGDEPMISSECILPVINAIPSRTSSPYFGGAMRTLTSPSEVIDPANIKLAVSGNGRCLYMSRMPVPFPKGSLSFHYMKYVGVECFNKSALDFFVRTPMGSLEKYEDIDHLRFLENGITMKFNLVESESISVDTPKDLDFVREKLSNLYYRGGGMRNLSALT